MDLPQYNCDGKHPRLPYAKLLFPVSSIDSSDGGSVSGFPGSLSSYTPRPDDSNTANPLLWPSWMTPTKDLDHCCSLLNNIWTYSPQATHNSTVAKSKVTQPITNSNFSFSRFSGMQTPQRARTVVSLDVKQIRPVDEPHHPFDREFGSSYAAPTKMFTRMPHGIAVNSKTEQIYVADREYNVVLILGPDGCFQSQLGGLGSEPGKFFRPTALAFDVETDRLYVTDKDNHRVQVFNATSGQFLFRFGSKGNNAGQFCYPWGIAILNNKEGGSLVAVADSRNARIMCFTKEGLYLDHFDIFTKTEENDRPTKKHQPRGLAFDPTGDCLYISDFNHHSIMKLDLPGRTIEKFGVTTPTGSSSLGARFFNRPTGIDVDSQGNLIVCDQRHHSLRMFRKDGTEVDGFLAGISFKHPKDVSLYPGLPGYLAVIDFHGKVRVLNYS